VSAAAAVLLTAAQAASAMAGSLAAGPGSAAIRGFSIDTRTLRAGDVYCVVDPEAPDHASFEAAIRLARLLALVSTREQEVEVDAPAVKAALAGVREQLEAM
jgi:UDP-N-acetylmuramyl pentapeptide synthase